MLLRRVILWEALEAAYDCLGFTILADEAFKAMVLTRLIEPASKAVAYRTQTAGWASLVMYDVTTLPFEAKDEDKLRKVGMSKVAGLGFSDSGPG